MATTDRVSPRATQLQNFQTNSTQLTLYSYVGSQWAGVPQLGLAEKGYKKDEFDKEIDLCPSPPFRLTTY
jgi:hypothetical protein